ncbi:MAG TPA: SprT family protein, partial [Candidatus Paceibacterota bacterium]
MKKVLVLPSIKVRVYRKMVECIAKIERHYNITLRRPQLLFNKRGTIAASANSDNWSINLNPILLNENTDEF